MTAQITTDKLVQAITNSRAKDSMIEAIAKATQGASVSANIISNVEKKLAAAFEEQANGDAAKLRAANMIIGRAVNALKVSPQLSEILKTVEAAFGQDVERDGTKPKATNAAIKAAIEGKNDLAAVVEEACPVLEGDSLEERQKKQLRKAIDRAIELAADYGAVKAKLTAIKNEI